LPLLCHYLKVVVIQFDYTEVLLLATTSPLLESSGNTINNNWDM